jgi:hypothetical protein
MFSAADEAAAARAGARSLLVVVYRCRRDRREAMAIAGEGEFGRYRRTRR